MLFVSNFFFARAIQGNFISGNPNLVFNTMLHHHYNSKTMLLITKTCRHNLLGTNPAPNLISWALTIGFFTLTFQLFAQGNIELYNRFQKGSLQFENGKPVLKTQGNNAIWMIETIANSTDVRIKHVPTGGYLHAETDAQFPGIGPIQPGWWSAMWSIEFTEEGYYRIKNKWRNSYLRNETGVVELGESQPGWWGGQWLYVSPGVANGRATASPPTGRLKIRGVYIVPSDQQAKPKAKEAIAAGLAIMQAHFLRQIGVTFEYEPEVAIIYSNHDAKATASMEIALELCKKTLGTEYESNKNIMFTVVEGCPGGTAYGSPGVTRIQQGFWGNVYSTFINNPSALASTLPAWSHELGHAFGLNHTGELTKDCMLKNCQVDMGTLPPLLMQQSQSFPTVYEYPFHKDEIKMLLDSTYCQTCLIPRGTRPAAVRYLRTTTAQANNSGGNTASNNGCGCGPQTFRSVSDHTWVEFRLPQGTSSQTINIPAGAHNKYVFPKCNRVWWDNLTFKCNASTCQWERSAGKWDADAWCTGSPGNSPYVFVGEK